MPRRLTELAELNEEEEMTMQEGKLIIRPARNRRQDWEAQFALLAEIGDDPLFDEPSATAWDEEEWIWPISAF